MARPTYERRTEEREQADPYRLELRHVSRSFGATRALKNVSIAFRAGEVHVLAGGNGAGKSTLIKILSGADSAYQGELWLDGAKYRFRSPSQARAHGIVCIYQELSLIPNLSLVDNIGVRSSVVPASCSGVFRSRADRQARHRSRELLRSVGLNEQADQYLDRPVGSLSLAERQLLEIGAALLDQASVLILDEPTSALSELEAHRLFAHIERVKRAGTAVVYISHRLEETFRLADRISVLRDGELLFTTLPRDLSPSTLVQAMVGPELEPSMAPEGAAPPARQVGTLQVRSAAELLTGIGQAASASRQVGADPLFSVEALAREAPPRLEDIRLQVGQGEIVGLCGLRGSSAKALLFAIFGALPASARMKLGGQEYVPTSPRHAYERGIALLTTDRRASLFAQRSLLENAVLSSLWRLSRAGLILTRPAALPIRALAGALGLRVASLNSPAAALSGGNQQKLALLRCVLTGPRLLLLEDPTRGVDVAAKLDIYSTIRGLAAAGVGVLIESSELEELVTLCDRVHVFSQAAISATVSGADLNRSKLTELMMGGPA